MGLMDGVRRLLLAGGVIVAAMAGPVAARTVLELDVAQRPVSLQDWGDSWIDTEGDAQAAQVATDKSIVWLPTRDDAIHPLAPGKALWIRFTVPPAPDAERWYLGINYPALNRVTLYSRDSAGQWTPQVAGDAVPVAHWPVPHRYPLIPVAVSAEEPLNYLVRIENAHSFSSPLVFVSDSYHNRHEQRTALVLGLYFGLAGLAVMLAALSAVSLRDSAYAAYAVAVALMALSQASHTGIAGLHLWPGSPRWNDIAALILPVLTAAALLRFFAAVVSLPERSVAANRGINGLAILGVAIALAMALVVPPAQRFRFEVLYVAIAAVAGLSALAWAARRGDRYAPWVLGGTLPVAFGAAFPLASTWGLIPQSFLTLHAMQIGIAIELPVLLVILMFRSQQRRENSRRIIGLDRIDPATGLINRHVFTERLARMISRAQRLKHSSAVLLVDIVNIDQIRRDFDRRSAEELPLRVAGRMLSAAREIDSVARLSERRFGMLVEGPLSPEDAASAGPRVVARCLMPFKNKPVEWVAQVRVVQTLVPLGTTDAVTVIARLEALLGNVPADTKRAVFTLKN